MLLRRNLIHPQVRWYGEAIMVVMAAIIILLLVQVLLLMVQIYTLTGVTESSDLIATPGAWKTSTQAAGTSQIFVSCFDASGGILQWGTYYGNGDKGSQNSNWDWGFSIAADHSGNIYVAGATTSQTGIATAGAWQTSYAGGINDAFIAKFNPSGFPIWGTYFGGEDYDLGQQAIALDACDMFMYRGLRFPPLASLWQAAGSPIFRDK